MPSDPDPDGGPKVAGVVTAAAGAAVGAALVVDPVSGAAIGSAISAGLDRLIAGYVDYQRGRAGAWWTEYLRHLGTMTARGAVTEAAGAAATDPHFQKRVYLALQAVWSAVDEAVLPCLAYLAADYEARGEPVDPFFKHLARFLQETTDLELEAVRKLIAALEPVFATGTLRADARIQRGDARLQISTAERPTFNKLNLEVPTEMYAVLRRLRDSYLADEGDVWGENFIAVTWGPKGFERLARYLARPFTKERVAT